MKKLFFTASLAAVFALSPIGTIYAGSTSKNAEAKMEKMEKKMDECHKYMEDGGDKKERKEGSATKYKKEGSATKKMSGKDKEMMEDKDTKYECEMDKDKEMMEEK